MSLSVEVLAADLRGKFGCHAVLLYGSRARGDASSVSDWDLAGVRAEGPMVRDARQLPDGTWLDAWVYSEEEVGRLDDGSLKFLGARVLVDERGFAANLLARVAAFEAAGPTPSPPDEIRQLRAWFLKTLERARRGQGSEDDVEGHFREVWMRTDLLATWFRLQSRWFRGSKAGWAELRRDDPETFETFAAAVRPGAGFPELERAVARLLASTPTGD